MDSETKRNNKLARQKLDRQNNPEKHQEYKRRYLAKKSVTIAPSPATVDMDKVLAFVNKRNGSKILPPLTPNMAKVREFIKYA